MTTSPQAQAFDTGPLSWVIGEIRDALAAAGAALREAAARSLPAQPTMLLHAKTHLHQAHGALQMVDVAGVGTLAAAAEQALDRFKDGRLACTGAHAQVVTEAFQALSEYLDELLAGHPPQPMRLFPYHRALQELLGAARVHPSDLLQVDLAAPVALPPQAVDGAAPDYPACRARFEKALLAFMKSADAEGQRTHALELQEAIAPIARAQQEPQARTFWLAMHSVAALAAQGQLASDLYLKQLFGQVNLQVRRLAQGQGSLPQAMLRDALFFIAAAPAGGDGDGASLLRGAYRLDGQVPAAYSTPRYGRIDGAALKLAREALAQAKADWDRLASSADASLEASFNHALATLGAASDKLGVPALARLLRELARAANGSIAAGRSDQFSLEMATAMLFVEHGIDQVRQLPEDFAAHAEVVGARLLALAAGETPPQAPQWRGDLARRLQQGQTVAALAGEIRNSLRQVEKLVDQFHAGQDSGEPLALAEALLHQLQGALALLDQDAAMRAVRHVKDGVARLAASQDRPALLGNIARNLTALGFFTDLLAQNADAARRRFGFDEADGLLRDLSSGEPPPVECKRIGALEVELPLYDIYRAETDELMQVLKREFAGWRAEPQRPAPVQALRAVHTLAGASATVGFAALRDVAAALESTLETLAAASPPLDEAQRAVLEAALERIDGMLQDFARGELACAQPGLVAQLEALREQVAVRRGAGADGAADPELARRLDQLFAATYESLVGAAPQPASLVEEIAPVPIAGAHAAPVVAGVAAPLGLPPPLVAEPAISDELDPDLLPVFLEEASDLFPQVGNGLRQWQQDPADSAAAQQLLRTLHTVKGSARMAGAMRLGQHTHELETQIENMVHAGTSSQPAFDELLANYDQSLLLLEQLQQPAAGPEPAPPAAPVARTPLVRVRADILDRLVNQAGEVSITRSRLENQVGSLKTALSDFSEQLARLRRQLREVEMQAESQIASRLSIAGERQFDPLEFDRFTRLQELTRMMAESVGDVASFQDSLARTVDSAGEDLAAQSRLTRELQRDLMRARMVPFASLSERLFRVARQTAKETDKRVNLDIRGGSVELDRSVLEQMAAPFEHLLRNAIVHGIEGREQRAAAAKADTGELLVQVSQQGNEVAIEFSDDGAGLDLERIRARARSGGLLAPGAEVSDGDAAKLIFEPGFSTADALTELAGRGIGMDVVRSEALALGGRVSIATRPGQGACFTIHLPLTLAVTQVVLVACGGRTHALPSTLVEQVLQVKDADLAAAYKAGVLQVQGQLLALHHLRTLLGEGAAAAGAQGERACPVMIARSGAGRIALQVDEVLGNREVVVKNIGPQLSRMPGVTGATVLGSGDIVLILNPLALAQHGAHLRVPARAAGVAPQPAAPRRTIMVVDDSLTVRRVTQRLLEREGYHVVLAKDGVDALEQMQRAAPDLMVVDIEMPRMDGFDLARHVRGNEATQAIPIVMVTSRTADKHRNHALELGVNAYFGKPYQEPVLLEAIADLLVLE
ncbi:MAG: response regulator [Massilia sp.]